jgi:hypothetical protein
VRSIFLLIVLAYARLFTNKLRIAKQHRLNLPPFNISDKFNIRKRTEKSEFATVWKTFKNCGINLIFWLKTVSYSLNINFAVNRFNMFNHLSVLLKISQITARFISKPLISAKQIRKITNLFFLITAADAALNIKKLYVINNFKEVS